MRSGAVISLTKERSKECVDEKIKVKMGGKKSEDQSQEEEGKSWNPSAKCLIAENEAQMGQEIRE